MQVSETERLTLRWLELDDAAFIYSLVNDPSWLRYIGDRGVRSLDDARNYIQNGPQQMYASAGFGLNVMVRKSDGALLGLCGLLRRDSLPDVDIGYALLPSFAGQGYALEAAQACVDLARTRFRLRRLIAITVPDNAASARLLTKLGMVFEETFAYGADGQPLNRYGMDL